MFYEFDGHIIVCVLNIKNMIMSFTALIKTALSVNRYHSADVFIA